MDSLKEAGDKKHGQWYKLSLLRQHYHGCVLGILTIFLVSQKKEACIVIPHG